MVDAMSPQFVSVYNEASAAESYGLSEIAGLAYRKSLEFLVKDYCIRLAPDDAEKIKGGSLSAVIKTYFKDTMIGQAAEKAAWLGNDEAHYIRKWEEHDINSLKSLLRIVINGINEKLEFDTLMASFESKEAIRDGS